MVHLARTFAVGMIICPTVLSYIFSNGFKVGDRYVTFESNFTPLNVNLIGWIVGGLAVGFGYKLAHGDTSAHVFVGIPHLSRKSILSAIFFFGTAILTSTFLHQFFDSSSTNFLLSDKAERIISYFLFLGILIAYGVFCVLDLGSYNLIEHVITLGLGVLFGMGLLTSGMCNTAYVQNYLTISKNYYLIVPMSMAICAGINFFVFRIFGAKNSMVGDPAAFHVGSFTVNNAIGSALFGFGYGLTYLCPGPALILVFS